MPVLSTLSPPELLLHQFSFMDLRDLWSLQLTCQSNRSFVQSYLGSKFNRYLSKVLENLTNGGDAMVFGRLLDIADAIVVGEFTLAMMAKEEDAQGWSFDSLQIIVPEDSAIVLEDYFRTLDYEWTVDDGAIFSTPNATPPEVLDFIIGTLSSNSASAEIPSFMRTQQNTGISLLVCDRDVVMKCLGNAPSTALASFVTPHAIFCAFPELTFGKYAIATCRFPTSATLSSHFRFKYNMHITNEFWDGPCGVRCPSLYRCLTASFAVVPFQEPRADFMWMLEGDTWWKMRADCYNMTCPHYGFYLE